MPSQLVDTLKAAPLFADMSDEDLETLIERGEMITLAPGEVLFEEGDDGDTAFVVCAGEVEILKKAGSGGDVKLADRGAGEVIGEIALLMDERRSATVRARIETTMLRLARNTLEELIDTSITAARAVHMMLLERWRNTEAKLRHRDHMATIGTLSAGLAHELNNPAAALESASRRLPDALARRDDTMRGLVEAGITDEQRGRVDALVSRCSGRGGHLTALQRSTREEEVEDLLLELGVQEVWTLAGGIADSEITNDELRVLGEEMTPEQLTAALRFVVTDADLSNLADDLRLGAGRISDLVDAMKRHIYLDQAPVQVVSVKDQIENNLRLLASKLGDIQVEREYADDLPSIEAHGSELNQVWSNLIDNAIDALRAAGRAPGTITIKASGTEGGVRVEIEDDGTGIPAEIRHRVFDSFFTTKPPGSGTGLGLDIVHSTVVDRHHGTVELESGDGWTRFVVELPKTAPQD